MDPDNLILDNNLGDEMQVSAWNDGGTTYGLRVGSPNRDKFFNPEWDEIHLEIEGATHRLSITPTFCMVSFKSVDSAKVLA